MTSPAALSRTTSPYFLRVAVDGTDPETLLTALVTAVGYDRPVTDRHTDLTAMPTPWVSVGFRAAGDGDALTLTRHVLTAAGADEVEVCLFTGHGMHRRIVEVDGHHVALSHECRA